MKNKKKASFTSILGSLARLLTTNLPGGISNEITQAAQKAQAARDEARHRQRDVRLQQLRRNKQESQPGEQTMIAKKRVRTPSDKQSARTKKATKKKQAIGIPATQNTTSPAHRIQTTIVTPTPTLKEQLKDNNKAKTKIALDNQANPDSIKPSINKKPKLTHLKVNQMTSPQWLNVSGKENNCLLHAVAVDMEIDSDLAKAFLEVYGIKNVSPDKQVALVKNILNDFKNSKDRTEILAYALRKELKIYFDKNTDATRTESLLLATTAIKEWVESDVEPKSNANLQGYTNFYKATEIKKLCASLRVELIPFKTKDDTFTKPQLDRFWNNEKIQKIRKCWMDHGYKEYVRCITTSGTQLSIYDAINFLTNKKLFAITLKSTNLTIDTFTPAISNTTLKQQISLKESGQHWYREIEDAEQFKQLQADHQANPTRKRLIENKNFPAIRTLINQKATTLLQKINKPNDFYLYQPPQTDNNLNKSLNDLPLIDPQNHKDNNSSSDDDNDTTTGNSDSEKEVPVQPSITTDASQKQDDPQSTDTLSDTNSEFSEAPNLSEKLGTNNSDNEQEESIIVQPLSTADTPQVQSNLASNNPDSPDATDIDDTNSESSEAPNLSETEEARSASASRSIKPKTSSNTNKPNANPPSLISICNNSTNQINEMLDEYYLANKNFELTPSQLKVFENTFDRLSNEYLFAASQPQQQKVKPQTQLKNLSGLFTDADDSNTTNAPITSQKNSSKKN